MCLLRLDLSSLAGVLHATNSWQNTEFSSSPVPNFLQAAPAHCLWICLHRARWRIQAGIRFSLYFFFSVWEVRWPIFEAGTGYWLTDEILCCQDPWKYQKGMMMFLCIFLNSSFELFSQMLSLDTNILQYNALFLGHLCQCFSFPIAGAGKPGSS